MVRNSTAIRFQPEANHRDFLPTLQFRSSELRTAVRSDCKPTRVRLVLLYGQTTSFSRPRVCRPVVFAPHGPTGGRAAPALQADAQIASPTRSGFVWLPATATARAMATSPTPKYWHVDPAERTFTGTVVLLTSRLSISAAENFALELLHGDGPPLQDESVSTTRLLSSSCTWNCCRRTPTHTTAWAKPS